MDYNEIIKEIKCLNEIVKSNTDAINAAIKSRDMAIQRIDELRENYVKDIQSKHKDAAILFRCGDFYECRGDYVEQVADAIGITVTKIGKRVCCGFPHYALDTYLPKLVRSGLRVAICDELMP